MAVRAGHNPLRDFLHDILDAIAFYGPVLDAECLTRVCNFSLRLKGYLTLSVVIHNTRYVGSHLKRQTVNVNGEFAYPIICTLLNLIGGFIHLGVLLFEEIAHCSHAVKCEFADGYLLDRAVGPMFADDFKVLGLNLNTAFRALDETLHLWQLVVDVDLVYLMTFLLGGKIANLALGLVLQYGILTARQLSGHITERVLFLFKYSVLH